MSILYWGGYWLTKYGVGVPNGSLWTITVDVQFYLSVYIIARFMKKKSMKFWTLVIFTFALVSLILEQLSPLMPEIAYKLLMVTIIPFLYIFMFGMMVYNFRDKLLPLFARYKWLIVVLYTIWELLPDGLTNYVYGVRYNVVTTILLMCVVFAVGYGFGKHRVKTDYTFAFYLYHIVVINFVIQMGIKNIDDPIVFIAVFILEFAVIMLFSYFSVHIIEKRVSNALLDKVLLHRSIKNGKNKQ